MTARPVNAAPAAPARAKAFAEPESDGHPIPDAAPAELVWIMPVPWEVQLMQECREWHGRREPKKQEAAA